MERAIPRDLAWFMAYLVAMHANITNDSNKDSETAGMESAEDANEAMIRYDEFLNRPVEE